MSYVHVKERAMGDEGAQQGRVDGNHEECGLSVAQEIVGFGRCEVRQAFILA
jgi:hypothetical protein